MKHGPQPIFTHRLHLKIRTDQRQALDRLASCLGLTMSEVVRWILDNGIDAVERSHTALTEEANHAQTQ